ncbi:Hint domain-containing protein [Aliiroseovarius marinus]|uniref:Hint domain-containing protein n=1 Tax=Aliiroseovarius marinus TaxID=2500159 RepID=UPI003D7CB5FE
MFLNTATDFANALPADLADLMDPKRTGQAGMVSGTRVETAAGWRNVEHVMKGDAVFTLDGGLRVVRGVMRSACAETRGLHVPGGALGNCDDMWLMPGQEVLIEAQWAQEAFGTPLAMLPATALAGYRGISWGAMPSGAEAVSLVFDEEEVVYANSGVLLGCAGARSDAQEFFRRLSDDEAHAMVALMIHGTPFERAA